MRDSANTAIDHAIPYIPKNQNSIDGYITLRIKQLCKQKSQILTRINRLTKSENYTLANNNQTFKDTLKTRLFLEIYLSCYRGVTCISNDDIFGRVRWQVDAVSRMCRARYKITVFINYFIKMLYLDSLSIFIPLRI